jgi:O-antigen/teichoic acid export membrane protein
MPGAGSTGRCGAFSQAVVNKECRTRDPETGAATENSTRVAKNTIVLVTLRVLMPALAVSLILLLSRALGVEGLGRYTLAFSFLYMFNAIAPLGLSAIITRDGARDRDGLERLLANATSLGILSSLLMTLCMAGLALLLNYDDETRVAILILSLAILPCTIGAFQDSTFVALERMDYLAIGTIAEYIFKVGGGILLLLSGYGLEAVLAVAILGRVLGCTISAAFLHKLNIRTRLALNNEITANLLRLAPTFLFIGIFATLYWRIDIFMLSKLQPVEAVGYYGAAWRILELAMVVPQSLCLSLYPQISSAALNNLDQLNRLGRNAIRYLLALSLPAAIGVTLLAGPLLKLLFGEGFSSASDTLSVLILTLIPYGIVRYHAYVLLGANHQRIDLGLNIVMSIINIALNLALIPVYGHFGAAVATFISICIYGLLQYGYLLKKLPGHAVPISLPPVVLVASLVMALCIWLMRDLNLMIVIPAAAITYGGLLLAGGFFSEDELKLIGLHRLRQRLGRS